MSVVIGYSPSDQGRSALRAGLREARSLQADLVVACHAYQDATGSHAAAEDEVRTELEAARADTSDAPLPTLRVHRSAEAEDVGSFLLEIAEREQARLLVIGLRAKSRSGKLNLGASARKVVLGSPCPVLAVKDGAGRHQDPSDA